MSSLITVFAQGNSSHAVRKLNIDTEAIPGLASSDFLQDNQQKSAYHRQNRKVLHKEHPPGISSCLSSHAGISSSILYLFSCHFPVQIVYEYSVLLFYPGYRIPFSLKRLPIWLTTFRMSKNKATGYRFIFHKAILVHKTTYSLIFIKPVKLVNPA